MKMGEGCFESIQLIDNFVSARTLRWGKFGVNSYSNRSWSQGDFEAFGHKEIALDKTFTVAPPTQNIAVLYERLHSRLFQ
jgi:hypothetical protein